MPGVLPSTTKFREMVAEYLNEASDEIIRHLKSLNDSTNYRGVYRTTWAADNVLSKLKSDRNRPSLDVARDVIRRIPLLVAVGQVSVAQIELRRFLEVTFWIVYFSDHPVEWFHFAKAPDRGYAQHATDPIAFGAHREMGFYAGYAKELMKSERSGLAAEAVTKLRELYRRLSATVHPGSLAVGKTNIAPIEPAEGKVTEAFLNTFKRVSASACLLLAAFNTEQFRTLDATARANFDWLIGTRVKKSLQAGPFGLPNIVRRFGETPI